MRKEETLLDTQITPNEVIAVNIAIDYYRSRCRDISPVYEQARVLLEQFQKRVNVYLPAGLTEQEVDHPHTGYN
ncbi:MAG TPA: hypothetical protein VKR06_16995 [Ktedonosporobacter sp.]|nr:hypothetical protein [Ktedonosporobacter sp.]